MRPPGGQSLTAACLARREGAAVTDRAAYLQQGLPPTPQGGCTLHCRQALQPNPDKAQGEPREGASELGGPLRTQILCGFRAVRTSTSPSPASAETAARCRKLTFLEHCPYSGTEVPASQVGPCLRHYPILQGRRTQTGFRGPACGHGGLTGRPEGKRSTLPSGPKPKTSRCCPHRAPSLAPVRGAGVPSSRRQVYVFSEFVLSLSLEMELSLPFILLVGHGSHFRGLRSPSTQTRRTWPQGQGPNSFRPSDTGIYLCHMLIRSC